ncbi:MAG: hypothetical protein FWH55_05925 [Oscillospiraceae bacterium]|nr:hypothetical protein [Oscillospiraceae bacterium]
MNDSRITTMLGYDDVSWGLLMFEKDPMKQKIAAKNWTGIIENALAAGCAAGDAWAFEHPWVSFAEWLKSGGTGIKIVFSDETQCPPLLVFSTYTHGNKQITLYSDAINRAVGAAQGRVDELAKNSVVRELLLAHEFFHYMDECHMVNFGGLNVFQYKILGWERKFTPVTYCEIAANAFAKKVCGAPFFPVILDVLLLASFDPNNIEKYYNWFRENARPANN